MLIIDDFIPIEEQEKIKEYLLGRKFPWFFVPNITNPNDEVSIPAFSHVFMEKGIISSNVYESLSFIGKLGALKYDANYKNIFNVRSFLQLPSNSNTINPYHVDLLEDHIVVLYYVIDSNGDTIILNKKYDSSNVDLTNSEIVQRVTPKQGRVLIFDGLTYHASSTPKDAVRCIINFDIIK
jgi:hypothetical protein